MWYRLANELAERRSRYSIARRDSDILRYAEYTNILWPGIVLSPRYSEMLVIWFVHSSGVLGSLLGNICLLIAVSVLYVVQQLTVLDWVRHPV